MSMRKRAAAALAALLGLCVLLAILVTACAPRTETADVAILMYHALGKLRGAHFAVSAHAFASLRSKAAARIVCARREKPCAARKCSFWIASRPPSVVYYFCYSFQIFFRSNGRGQV